MRSRTELVPNYLMYMYKEEPPTDKIRRRLIRVFRKHGPGELEEEWRDKLGVHNIWGMTYDASGNQLVWSYVEGGWWIRKHKSKWEFGRIYALENRDSSSKIFHGLWNNRVHRDSGCPIIVYSVLGRRGVINGWNRHELYVTWDGYGGRERVDFGELEFEFIEDYNKFKRLFDK